MAIQFLIKGCVDNNRTAGARFCGSVLSLVKKCCAFSSRSMRIAGVILPGPSVGGTLWEASPWVRHCILQWHLTTFTDLLQQAGRLPQLSSFLSLLP